MKLALFVLAIVLLAWMIFGRKRRPKPPAPGPAPAPEARAEATSRLRPPAVMRACAHCGVLLPEGEVVRDEDGQPFCGDAHRLAGPRERA